MSLTKQTGNMYSFVTHTWNPIKGKCLHDCSYCYMKRFSLKDVRLDEKELKTDLGLGNFIFIGSGTDMFADNIPAEWIDIVMQHCAKFDNEYLFQSKNPRRFYNNEFGFPDKTVVGTTIETNRFYQDLMGKTPKPEERAYFMYNLKKYTYKRMITIEPILDFDLNEFSEMIKSINPSWVNIGADSKGHKMPEPGKEKIQALIDELSTFTTVKIKTNLSRLMK